MAPPKLVRGTLYINRDRDYRTSEWGPYVKIGIVRNDRESQDRVKEHQTGNPREVVTMRELQSPMVHHLETQLHHRFATMWLSGEWFEMDQTFVDSTLIPEAEKIIGEQNAFLEDFTRRAELKNRVSSGEERLPTVEEREVWKAAVRATEKHTLAKARKDQWDFALRAAVGDSGGIPGVVKLVKKNKPDWFDQENFTEAHADLAAQYVVKKPSIRGSLSLKGSQSLAKLDTDLHEAINEAKAAVPEFTLEQIETPGLDRTSTVLEAHSSYVGSLAAVACADWDRECFRSRLVRMLGTDEAIKDTISWKREENEQLTFDKSRLKQEHEELYNEFTTQGAWTISVEIHYHRAYLLGR